MMKIWQIAGLVVLLPTVVFGQKCPSGWLQYNYQCFQLFSNQLNWHEARMACQGLGGDLAALKTKDVNNYIAQFVNPTQIQHWIGLHDISDEGQFTWSVDEELMDVSQNMWDLDQPDNWGNGEDCAEMRANGMWNDIPCMDYERPMWDVDQPDDYGPTGEDCALIRTNGKWNDYPCVGYYWPYICERPNDVLIKCDEANGWVSAESSCYKFYGYEYAWQDANSFCMAVGAELISVQSQEEQNVVTLQAGAYKADVWIGATDLISGVPGGYTWPDGTNIGPYTNWGPGQPDNSFFSMGGNCAEVLSTATDGQWNTAACSTGRKFICEKPEGTCPDGWRIYRGNCYQINTHNKYTWTDSKHFCETQGSFMVDIQSSIENNYIVSLFEELQNIGITDVWIGVSDVVTDGTFAWSDGSSLGYTNWNPNQPVDNTGPDCGTIFTGTTDGKWNTGNCYGLQAFVCKVPVGHPVFPVPPELPLGDCPPGWNLNGENCYYLETQKVKYAEAKAGCEAFGATLTSVLSPEEQSYHTLRASMLKDWLWIGFHDVTDEGNFEWEDGSDVTFTNWGPGQPDNWGDAGEDCTHMRSGETDAGQWNDLPCTSNSGYMCKLPKACDEYTSGDTNDDYFYRYHPAQKSVEYIYFEVKADNDVHIGLSPVAGDADPMYEIVIGGYGNTLSAVRRCKQCSNVIDAPTPDILNMNEWRGFWITYNMNTGKMEIGKEAQQAFITYTDPDPIQVKYVGYSTGWGSDGLFRFCNLTNVPTPEPTPIFDPRCGLGWEYDEATQNCYLFQETQYLSWSDAEEFCNRDGGNLASIISVAEQTYLNGAMRSMSESALWIGANDMSTEGGWQWSSGDPYRYLNWNAGEPNNYGPLGEHCVTTYTSTGKWNDDACSTRYGFICKKSGFLPNHFTVSPSLYLPDNNKFRLTDVYPDSCAFACLYEQAFNCLSFDYNKMTKECDLSDTTGSLNGELYTDINYDYYERVPALEPPPLPTTLPPSYRCDSGWYGYGSNCYQAQNVLLTMQDSRTRCRTIGGDIVSIHDKGENDYVLSLLKSAGITSPIWIGLNDLTLQHSFDWTDGSVVDYTFWNSGEPNNYGDKGEDCVEMYSNGAWNDQECEDLVPSVCKRRKTDLGPTQFPITPSGCSLGWVPYQWSCYYVETEDRAMWADAITKCGQYGGNLVHIMDRFEQTVLTSQLGLQNGQLFWIGLSDLDSPGEYTWSNGKPVTYTHWDQGMPDNSKGDCVAATSGIVSGMWQDSDCNNKFNYVCESGRIGFTAPPVTQPPPKTNPSNQGCAPGWIGYGNNCFRVDEVPNSETLFWVDANDHCMNMGATLASFHSREEEDYIKAQAGVGNTGAGFWIGLHDQSVEGGFEWTDGSPVDHTSWNTGEPNDSAGEDCVEMFFNDRGWNDMACNYYRSWVCKIAKGVVPYTTPAPPTPSPYPSCPTNSDWMLRGDYCYYYSAALDDRRGWVEANSYCMDNGGYLISIHGSDEMDFVTDIVIRLYDYHSHWIGIRTYSSGGVYTWSDNTPVDYSNWLPGEPNDYNGEEECGEVYSYSDTENPGTWNDANCGNKIPFICKKPNGNIEPITYPPTPVPVGNCPTGAFKYDNRCYQFHGESESDRLGWEDARVKCEDMGMTLATIHSQQVQSFLTTQLKDLGYRMWIGLSDRTNNARFVWADGTTVDFTNWNNGEPNESGGEEDCVEMLYKHDQVGRWNDVTCGKINGYVCQRNPDPSLPDPGVQPNKCKSGYTQYYDSCFKVDTSQSSGMTFSQAQTACQSDGTTLASIIDAYEQSYVETQLHIMGDNPLWVGLVDDKVAGEYSWVDGWPVWYTNWGQSEPSKGPGEGCVSVKFDGSWDDTVCTNKYMPLCKYSFVPAPTNPPDAPGTCDDGWLAWGSDCYLYNTAYLSWPESEYQCEKYGATIASIHSRQENEFIQNVVAKDTYYDLWLGLHRDDDGGFMWHDGSPVQYVNWADGEPTWEWNGEHENCVEMWYTSGYWNDIDCLYSQYSICKKPKTPFETDKPTPGTLPMTTRKPPRTYPPGWTGSTEPLPPTRPRTASPVTGMSAGGIVGIIIGVIALLGLVGVVVFFIMSKRAGNKSPLDIGSVGFDNALYNSGSSGAVQVHEKGSIDDPTSVA